MIRTFRSLAEKRDLEGMWRYYQNAIRKGGGKEIGRIMEQNRKKSLESQYEVVKRIIEE